MDANLLNFLISVSSGFAANMSSEGIKAAYQRVFSARPDLEQRIVSPASGSDVEAALGKVAGVLEAMAGIGSIDIEDGVLKALRSATFDHQNGVVRIGNSRIEAPVVTTGGTGTGETTISGNTEMRSKGTNVQVGDGATIRITENASIKQT